MMSWEEILGYQGLTASYRSTPSITTFPFTNIFYKSPRPIFGDKVKMVEVAATNTPGPMNSKGAAARVIQPKGGSTREFGLFHYFTELPIDPWALMSLQSMDSEGLQAMGREVVDLQLEEAAQKHRLAKEVILSNIMTYNAVDIDSNGNIQVPSVHATTGVITHATAVIQETFGVADDHRGDLGGIIAAQWSTASTSILDHLEAVRRQAGIDGAPDVTDIYVNAVHKTDLRANTEFNDWAKYTNVAGYANQVLSNFDSDMIVVFGKRWHFIAGTWTDSGGTTRDIMPQNLALMTPEPGGSWIRAFTGRTPVPTAQGIASPSTPLSDFTPVEGEYGYAYSQHNPARTSVFTGDTFGLGFANPNAIWVGKVFT